MPPHGYIYGLVDPRTGRLRYVGQTTRSLDRRLSEHVADRNLKSKTRKNSWIKALKHLGLIPNIVAMEYVPVHELDQAERVHISYYRDLIGSRLTNDTDGGTGGAMPPEAVARAAAKMRGRKHPVDVKRRMSDSARRRFEEDPSLREVYRERAVTAGNRPPPPLSGEGNPQAKLSDEQVRELRHRAAEGERGVDLAKSYGISGASVTQLVTGRTRKGAGGPTRLAKPVRKLSGASVLKIRHLRAEGMAVVEIARLYDVDRSHVSKICSLQARFRVT
jgi:hypothetical protein